MLYICRSHKPRVARLLFWKTWLHKKIIKTKSITRENTFKGIPKSLTKVSSPPGDSLFISLLPSFIVIIFEFCSFKNVNATPSANSLLSWFLNLALYQHHPRDEIQQVWEETGHLCFLSSMDDSDLQPGLGTTTLHQRSQTGSPWAKYTLKTYGHSTLCFKMFWISCQLLQIIIFYLKKVE